MMTILYYWLFYWNLGI